MNCDDYQRLLHLNRSGEISSHEADDLRDHLRLCEKCRIEYQRIQQADKLLNPLAAFTPAPKNPANLTADIMRRVREDVPSPSRSRLVDSILDFFLPPAIRYATAVVVLLIISTFLYQLVTTLNDVASVEQEMATVSGQKAIAPQATYTAESKTLEKVAASRDVKAAAGTLPVTMNGGQIEVSARVLQSIAPIYDLRAVSTVIGSSALHLDRKTLEKIINEVKATAESTLRAGREGA